MAKYRSTCRNCKCLHFFGVDSDEDDYPKNCYCVEVSRGKEPKCLGYVPKDNLEYLEWILDHEEKLESR